MLKDQFCSSPWIHMRITNSGGMTYCRWADKTDTRASIQDVSPKVFFQEHMADIRTGMLSGNAPAGCSECHQMEQHGKISGRQKQLLKIGVQLENFEKTLASSPWVPVFASRDNSQMPQDWQVDLGNYCNSACVFCIPESSSRLATEQFKLGMITQMPPPNWSDDPVLVQRFVDTLTNSSHIQYIHFIGGETLITPAFKIILKALIQAGLHRTVTLGFTTNLSVWKDDIVALLCEFQNVNLGMSIEAFTIVNDYVRWPVCLPTVVENMDRWREVANKHNWLMQFRTTPTALTVLDLDSVYDRAWHTGIAVESCNFLQRPEFMRASVLPPNYRNQVISKLEQWLIDHPVNSETVINIRNPNFAQAQIHQDLASYVAYLKNEPDESWRLPDLINYLKRIESARGNSVLTFRPEYEELFRSAGY